MRLIDILTHLVQHGFRVVIEPSRSYSDAKLYVCITKKAADGFVFRDTCHIITDAPEMALIKFLMDSETKCFEEYSAHEAKG